MDQFKIVRSLGYSCLPRMYLDHPNSRKYLSPQEGPTHYFDYIGTPVKAIYKLLKNGFEEHIDLNQIEMKPIFANQELFTHHQYYIRYMHDFAKYTSKTEIPFKYLEEFCDKYERRKERFQDFLKNEKENVLFLRIEESVGDRIMYDVIQDYYHPKKIKKEDFEYKYLVKLSQLLMERFKKRNFAILFLSMVKPNHVDCKNKIITVNNQEVIIFSTHIETFDRIFEANLEFINQSLNKIRSKF